MMIPKSIPQIRTESPFPWREGIMNGNLVVMVDAAGKQVPMFSITALAEQITAHITTQPAEATPQ
jgi:hypothetical protein